MVGGGGVQGRYGEVGSSVRGMARLRRIASSGWAGGEWARAGWVDMLFSARMDGLGPLYVCNSLYVFEVIFLKLYE